MEKEKSCLVTTSLIGSVQWYLESPTSVIKAERGGDGVKTWKEKALEDLKNTLGRVPGDFPEAAKKGVEFEKKVYEVVANKQIGKGSEDFQKICREVEGYEFYQKGGVNVNIEGDKVYFYAKYDAILPDKTSIKDLKTTASYKVGKYLAGIQHKMYCYISGAERFRYVVAEWEKYPKIKRVHVEDYEVRNRLELETDLFCTTKECFDVIKDLGLWELYRTKYCLY